MAKERRESREGRAPEGDDGIALRLLASWRVVATQWFGGQFRGLGINRTEGKQTNNGPKENPMKRPRYTGTETKEN